jgi:hypothetical protein
VLYLKLPGQSILVLDSLQAAEDLLDKRGVIYSDRPKFHLYELCVVVLRLIARPYACLLVDRRGLGSAGSQHSR